MSPFFGIMWHCVVEAKRKKTKILNKMVRDEHKNTSTK
jgi:hypothetical protein